jgi:hypothetical protein
MKVYAAQIPPEYQESPLFTIPEAFPEDIAVFGNRDFREHWPEKIERVVYALESDEIGGFLYDVNNGDFDYYENEREIFEDYLSPDGRGPYTDAEIDQLSAIFSEYGYSRRDENKLICAALEIVTGHPYECSTIRGNCQGDWQEIIYPAEDWSRDALRAFETEYFNTGSEWTVDEDGESGGDPDAISGFSVYCHGWSAEEIAREIADAAGCKPEEVVLFEFGGWTRTAKYTRMEA